MSFPVYVKSFMFVLKVSSFTLQTHTWSDDGMKEENECKNCSINFDHMLGTTIDCRGRGFVRIPFCKTSNVTTMLLQNNKIEVIKKNEFKHYTQLQTLELGGNKIQRLNASSFSGLGELRKLDLGETANDSKLIKTLSSKDPRNVEELHKFEIRCASHFWLIFSISSLVIITIVLILSYVAHVACRERLASRFWWLKRNYGYESIEPDGIYDAYIAYSNNDSNWVSNHLVRFLEREFQFKLFSSRIDIAVPSRTTDLSIANDIYGGIANSKRVIFVVTRSFLSNDWTNFVLEQARLHMYNKCRNKNILIILKDDIPVTDLPNTLRTMYNRIIFLKYPLEETQKRIATFWEQTRKVFTKCHPVTFDTGNGALYDAFIAYSNVDTNFVVNHLVRFLEGESQLKTFFYARDFTPSNAIGDEIFEGMKNSKKVIFVVTWSFLHSEWINYELEQARIHACKKCRNKNIIFILKDDIPFLILPSIVRTLYHRIEFLEYPSEEGQDETEKFWKKMKNEFTRCPRATDVQGSNIIK